ncbi:hypothetical protein FQZ97_1154250 [compost metagenome]
MDDAPTRDRLQYFQGLFAECGYMLECIRESQFGHPTRTQNLQILYQQSFGEDTKSASVVCSIIQSTRERKLTIQELLVAGASPQNIAYALFYGLVVTNLDRPLSPQTQLKCRRDYGQ